jgi:histidinol-phosphate aminotransferase
MAMPHNPYIETIRPYEPGKPVEEVEREYGLHSVVKLASNENPLGPSPYAVRAAEKALSRAALYPDSGSYTLTRKLAEKHGLPPDCLVIGTGSDHLFMLLALVLLNPQTNAVISEFTFPTYAIAVHSVGAELRVARSGAGLGQEVDHLLAAIDSATRVIFIDNPNNPIGSYLSRSAIVRLMDAVPRETLVVLDEAYYEFVDAPDYISGLEYLARYPNLMVTRTFSKAYGLAGFRIGYGLADPALVRLLQRVRLPFSISHLALAAAEAALADTEHLVRTRQLVLSERPRLAALLEKRLVRILPSQGNFVTAETPVPARQLFEALLKVGIIIRPLAGMGLPDHVRVSVGLPTQNQALGKALEAVLG